MNLHSLRYRAALASLVLALPLSSSAILFTNNTWVSFTNAVYDGDDIVVSNCTVTIDGVHAFKSLQVLSGGVLTHTYDGAGYLENRTYISGEPQVLIGTNGNFLASSNLATADALVQDATGTVTYTNGQDYTVTASSNQLWLITRMLNSSIPDGATVLVSYEVLNTTPTGLTLDVNGPVLVDAGAAIRADGRGFSGGPGYGGLGSFSGNGAGHGGYGGAGLSNAVGGSVYGEPFAPTTKGSSGGKDGGLGGGWIKLTSTDSIQVLGSIMVNGADGTNSRSGGGSGGSIWLSAPLLGGSGSISANGGKGEPTQGGGGAGGRIALTVTTNWFTGSVSARGGVGFQGGAAGTVYTSSSEPLVQRLSIDNSGAPGAVTALGDPQGVDVVVRSGAVASLPAAASVGDLLVGSNAWLLPPASTALSFSASNAIFEAGGGINLNGLGDKFGQGPGAGQMYISSTLVVGGGAGHGGYGGNGSASGADGGGSGSAAGGNYYDNVVQPTQRGSGGGGNSSFPGGSGGGAVKLTVAGTLQLDGVISANGTAPAANGAGGGSGGSVWLTVSNLSGSGRISANGGPATTFYSGGGAGGRIALYYTTNCFIGTVSAWGGQGFRSGAAGTVYSKPAQSSLAQLVLDNGGLPATNTPLSSMSGAFNLTLQGGAVAMDPGSTFSTLIVRSNSALLLSTQTRFICKDATIEAGASINADGFGYAGSQGPGRGYYYASTFPSGGGGGHGGAGGAGSNYLASGGMAVQDVMSGPNTPGSGGGSSAAYAAPGSVGGGVVIITAQGTMHVDGRISANGTGAGSSGAGGGAGGSIWLNVYRLEGTGTIAADGGAGDLPFGGGGGGGRIAVFYTESNLFTGTFTAKGGLGYAAGGAGTVYLKSGRDSVAQVFADNGGLTGTNTLLYGSSGTMDLSVTGGAWIGGGPYPPTYRHILIGSNSWMYGGGGNQLDTWSISGNLMIQAGGAIKGDGLAMPYSGYPSSGMYDSSSGSGGGGGLGGYGGSGAGANARGGVAYPSGNITQPQQPGYGGGSIYVSGQYLSLGGGALKLDMPRGTLTVDGRLSVNGAPGPYGGSGGGSGGSLWINAGTLAGTGIIAANGGDGDLPLGGGGGGGRLAVYASTNKFTGKLMARGGVGYRNGGAGTIYSRAPNANVGTLVVDNDGLSGTNTALGSFPSSTDLTVRNGGLALPSVSPFAVLNCTIETNSTLLLTNMALTANGNMTVARGGSVKVDAAGYAAGAGPGAGPAGCGGSHGGVGGGSATRTVDSFSAPALPGSGGGSTSTGRGGTGGGFARLDVRSSLTLNGRISADANDGTGTAGGGAGGSVYMTVGNTFSGTGAISANGGAGVAGGGGGIVTIVYRTNLFTGAISAFGGSGSIPGGAGTVYLQDSTDPGGTVHHRQLRIDNGGLRGAVTLLPNPDKADLYVTSGASAVPFNTPAWFVSDLLVGSGGCLTPRLPGTPVVPTRLEMAVLGNALIEESGSISLDALGNPSAAGLGRGQTVSGYGSGGGYGGAGGASVTAPGGLSYGTGDSPDLGGSGGGLGSSPETGGSQGGGALRLSVAGTLTMNGAVSADGNTGLQDNSGGGSGGSLWVEATRLEGTGLITALGGDGELFGGGGGGGGRIALYLRTNAFTGLVSAQGGLGYMPGEPGSIYAALPADLRVLSQTPDGIVTDSVDNVLLTFNSAVAAATFTAADVELVTPAGPLTNGVSISPSSTLSYRVSFPPQTAPGAYVLHIGADIQDLTGAPMSQVYTGSFSISLPVVQGTVTDTNGSAVPLVQLQVTGSGSAYWTDANGAYAVGAPFGTAFVITPLKPGWLFVPGSRFYTNISANISGENFLAVTSIVPSLVSGTWGSNLVVSCTAIPGVSYQLNSSSNLVDWVPFGGWLVGTNAPLSWYLPAGNEPARFFRVQAHN